MKRALIASVVCAAFMVSGCAAPPETRSSLADRQQLIVDPAVTFSMSVTELFEERIAQPDGSNLLHIQFAISAHSDADMAWQVTWFDANGMKVKGVGESYRKVSMLADQTRYFNAVAPHNRVTDFQLHLREPK